MYKCQTPCKHVYIYGYSHTVVATCVSSPHPAPYRTYAPNYISRSNIHTAS